MSAPIRILLVEDEPLWQQGVRSLLEADGRFELIGVAESFDEALDEFAEKKPEAVLLDWKIKGSRDGMDVGHKLLEEGLPAERIILISGSDPGMIPAHPFLFVPKSRIGSDLVGLLASVTIN